jgi:hypothetical protein
MGVLSDMTGGGHLFGRQRSMVRVTLPLRSLTILNSWEADGSNLGQLAAENRVKPWSGTQSQAKRINEIALLLFLRDQLSFPWLQ